MAKKLADRTGWVMANPANTESGEGLRRRAEEDRGRALRNVLDRILALDARSDDSFVSRIGAHAFDRVYGGQFMAQSLLAAAATVPEGRALHSVHCSFLRLGDPKEPIVYTVERLRDTRTFSSRLVRAEQKGACLTVTLFSFGGTEANGLAHQKAMPAAPSPARCVSRDVALYALYGESVPRNAGVPWPIDVRYVGRAPWDEAPGSGANTMWMRADLPLPDDPLLNACLLLYASDQTMFEPVIARHRVRWEDLIAGRGAFGASVDHAFWLHAPVRMDDWVLHEQESTRAGDGRGLATGRFYNSDGVLVASVAQEVYIRISSERDEA